MPDGRCSAWPYRTWRVLGIVSLQTLILQRYTLFTRFKYWICAFVKLAAMKHRSTKCASCGTHHFSKKKTIKTTHSVQHIAWGESSFQSLTCLNGIYHPNNELPSSTIFWKVNSILANFKIFKMAHRSIERKHLLDPTAIFKRTSL